MSGLPVFAFVVLGMLAISTAANAVCPTFHRLTNGTTADANAVMDNFDNIVACPKFNGRVDLSKTNSAINTTPSTAILAMDNPTGSQSLVDFTFGNVVSSIIRGDSSGNLVLSAASTIYIGDPDVSASPSPISLQSGAIYINNTRNVGIGTTTPGAALLAVAGRIKGNTSFGTSNTNEQAANSLAIPMIEIASSTFNSSNNYYMQVAPGTAGSDKTIDFISNFSGYVTGGIAPAFNFKKYDNTSWLY
jgi:hypothetical protein